MASRIGAALRRVVGIEQEFAPNVDSRNESPTPPDVSVDSGVAPLAPEVDSADPAEHARAVLRWLQAEGGASGELLASEIQCAYAEMCAERLWKPLSWHRVGKRFARLVGPRRYRDVTVDGKRCRRLAYAVPAEGEITSAAERAKHPAAPLPQRLTAIEHAIEKLADQIGVLVAAGSAGAGLQSQTEATVVNFESRRT